MPLDFVLKLEEEAGDPAVQLWRLIRFDVAALCAFPFDINEVHRLSRRAPDAFEVYWQERQALNDAVERLIARGVASGAFRPVDARLTALVVLSDDEGVQNWHRPIGGRRLAGRPDGDYAVDEIAEFLADTTLRGLLADPGDLARGARRRPDSWHQPFSRASWNGKTPVFQWKLDCDPACYGPPCTTAIAGGPRGHGPFPSRYR